MLSIYKASAGSGKTFTLARQYMLLLLGVKNPETGEYRLNTSPADAHRHILAVTFTNKATDEMKRRIIHELAVLACAEPGWTKKSDHETELIKLLHCTSSQLQQAAAFALKRLLFDYNCFNVSTIDSFFQTILRTFAHEVDIPGNYEVDLENDRATARGVRDLFDSLSNNPSDRDTIRITNWISDYLLEQARKGRKAVIFNRNTAMHGEIVDFINKITNDDFRARQDEMTAYLSVTSNLESFRSQVSELLDAVRADAVARCSELRDALSVKGLWIENKGVLNQNAVSVVQKVISSGGDAPASPVTMLKVLANPLAFFVGNTRKAMDKNPDKMLVDCICRAFKAVSLVGPDCILYSKSLESLFRLGLLDKVNGFISAFQSENNSILLSDTNSLLREIIADDDAPFVYERVGTWINHYLIDEFQDTSRSQWENIRPLLKEGQSSGHDSLIIGDEKQSIYRFRFSDPELLAIDVPRQMHDYVNVQGNTPEGNTNWRSSQKVVEFNNLFFQTATAGKASARTYANVCQQLPDRKRNGKGFVDLHGLKSGEKKFTASRAREESCKILLKRIKAQLAAGYRPCDIAVLVRKKKQGTEVIDYIVNHASELNDALPSGSPFKTVGVVSEDVLMLAKSTAVMMIVSILKLIATSREAVDESSRSGWTRKVNGLVNRFDLLRSRGVEANEALRMAVEGQTDDMEIEGNLGSMACFNLPGLVERVIACYLPEAVATQSLYISAFVDVVTDFCSRGNADLQSFIRWWDDVSTSLSVAGPEDESALRVMTIHKSKGLEFKCVHVFDANWKMVDFKDHEWFDMTGFPGVIQSVVPPMLPLKPEAYMMETFLKDQYEKKVEDSIVDELNIVYVAFTRAIDELDVYFSELPSPKSSAETAASSIYVNGLIANTLALMGAKPADLANTEQTPADPETPAFSEYIFGQSVNASVDKKESTALDPEISVPMDIYATSFRDDLWNAFGLERRLDISIARERGTLLHNVLAGVTDLDSLDKSLNRRFIRNLIRPGELDEIGKHLRRQLEREEIRLWFEGYRRVLRERTIFCPGHKPIRPDRVVWTSEGTIDVIDYKFGAEKPKEYARQVRSYINAITSMGWGPVRGFVFYVDSGKVTPVES